jgi:hypothetical protein
VAPDELLVFNTSDYSFLRRIPINHDEIETNPGRIEEIISISKDGSVVCFMSAPCSATELDFEFRECRSTVTGELLLELKGYNPIPTFSPTEDIVIEDAYGRPFRIWQASEGSLELLHSLCLDVLYADWLPKGRRILITENNGREIYVFDIDTMMPVVHIMDEERPGSYQPTFIFSNDEKYAISYIFEDSSGEITLWSMEND